MKAEEREQNANPSVQVKFTDSPSQDAAIYCVSDSYGLSPPCSSTLEIKTYARSLSSAAHAAR